jgi:pentatricopeptide repeat protein
MQTKPTVAGFLAVVCLLAAQNAAAGDFSSLGKAAAKTYGFGALGENLLERRFLADAVDGHLEEFSPLGAALVASGVKDAAELRRYEGLAAKLAEELPPNVKTASDERARARAVFEFLHQRVLRGGYELANTDIRRTLDRGSYNCITAVVLYNFLAEKAGLRCCGLEMPGHAMSRVFLADGTLLDVETTCPTWFQKDAASREKPSGGDSRVTDLTGRKMDARQVSAIQLAAMVYYNRGVDFLAQRRFVDAAAANEKALRLDPANTVARGNLLATLNNWSIELGNSRRFAEAADVLRIGMSMDADFAAFGQNFDHVHHQWVESLCRRGRYEEALEVLAKAVADMPDRPYLRRAQNEIFSRWTRAVSAEQNLKAAQMPHLPCVKHAQAVD